MTTVLTEDVESPPFDLAALYLEKCSVERNADATYGTGRVEGTVEVKAESLDDQLTYHVLGNYTFENQDAEPLATISMTFAAEYVGDAIRDLDEEQVQDFSRSVVVHVTPFMREFLATMMNRLALPQFLLPLVRADELVADRVIEDDSTPAPSP